MSSRISLDPKILPIIFDIWLPILHRCCQKQRLFFFRDALLSCATLPVVRQTVNA